jgi:signal transduction histidine kinase
MNTDDQIVLKQNTLNFSVDARTILQLGRDSIKNPTTAVIELVKNGYDADATKIDVEINERFIRIFDNGSGMDMNTLRNNWLRIGYSEKKEKTRSSKGRRKTGEKGIGRISADRLGKNLTLRTKTKEANAIELSLGWDAFDTDGVDLSKIDIPIKELNHAQYSTTGTEIVISDLRQNWQKEDIERLYLELSMLISPFVKENEFQITFNNNVAEEYNGTVETTYDDAAELRIEASYSGEGDTLTYTIVDNNIGVQQQNEKIIKLSQLTQDSLNKEIKTLSCGPVNLQILFFSRSSSFSKSKGLSQSELRKFLDVNAGIKIYRDDVSVKPFGYYKEPGGDWLGLAQRRERDPAGLSRPSYKVASYQLVGAVSVGRDTNPWLTDGSSREGLVENEAFNDLRNLTVSCVFLIEQYRHKQSLLEKKNKVKTQTSLEKVEEVKQDFDELRSDLSDLQRTKTIDDYTKDKIGRVVEKFESASQYIGEVIDENRVFRGLATIGISTAVFGHETQSTISRLKSQINSARNALTLKKPADTNRATIRLKEAEDSAYHVAKWGQFALSRVKKDKRTRKQMDVDKIVFKLLDEISDVFVNSNITLIKNIEPVVSKVFVMDIESILLNLLTNAYAFAGNSNAKTVRVELKACENKYGKKGFTLTVADSGPGVDEDMIDTIWEPLVSTKKDRFGYDTGTGLGLTIISNTVNDLEGSYSVEKDDELGGACFSIWVPIVGDNEK